MNGPARTPRVAMVLAAGEGRRMRPLTEDTPKPLLELLGETLIDRVLDRLAAAGVERAVVNTHHLAGRIAAHLADRRMPEIVLSPEEALLDTGGGVANALDHLGEQPFYVLNGDVLWLDGTRPALERLARHWNDDDMDALLLVHPTVRAHGYSGLGDFLVDGLGRARRRAQREVAPFVFTGIQMLHPRLFRDAPEPPFSLNVLYDQAEAAERLYAVAHDGKWFHVGTPEDLHLTVKLLSDLGFRPPQTHGPA